MLVAGDRRLGERHRRRAEPGGAGRGRDRHPDDRDRRARSSPPSCPIAADMVTLPTAPIRRSAGCTACSQTAITVQRVTLGLVDATGTNPDLIRREQDPSRAAAAVGDERSDW